MANKRLTKKLSRRKMERRQANNPTPQKAFEVLAQHLVDNYTDDDPDFAMYYIIRHGGDVKLESTLTGEPVMKGKVKCNANEDHGGKLQGGWCDVPKFEWDK